MPSRQTGAEVGRVPLRSLSRVPIVSGVGQSAQPYDPNQTRFVRTTDIGSRLSLRTSTRRSLPRAAGEKAPLARWDLLLSTAGTIGKSYLHVIDDERCCFAGFLARVRPRSVDEARYLSYWTQTHDFLDQVNRGAVVSTIANFSAGRYRGIQAPQSTSESAMRSILRHLDHAEIRIARAVAAKSALLSRLIEAKLAVVSELVLGDSDNRTSTGVPGLESVPSDWRWIRAKHVWRPLDVRSVRGIEERLSVSSARGVVLRSSANVTMFQAASYVGHKVVQPGNLVINSLWAWGRGLGVSQHFGLVSPVYGVYELVDKESDVAYLDHLLRSNAYQWQFQVRSKGIWKSRLSLSDDAFLDMPMVLPPLEEQRSISARISRQTASIQAAITAVEREIALLKEYRIRLISDVVTGKMEVTKEAAELPEIDPVELAEALAGVTAGSSDEVEDEDGGDDEDE